MADRTPKRLLAALGLSLALFPAGLRAGDPGSWVPVRWEGGPLEAALRAKDEAGAGKGGLREALTGWYNPATLRLLDNTPINCLLVTLSAGAAAEIEDQQHSLVREYARAARERGMAVLGIVHPGANPGKAALAAAEARLDGLVLDGDFHAEANATAEFESALRARNREAVVIPILPRSTSMRGAKAPVLAMTGVRPSARDLAEMGVRATASAEPWIESNIWLVRALRSQNPSRPVWIDQPPNPSAVGDSIRCVADAAVAGGRWIAGLDDDLRVGLYRKEVEALKTWRSISAYLQFAEEHADWREFLPYGNLGILVDTAAEDTGFADEYLNLVARRQVPYRLVARSSLGTAALAGFQALLAPTLAPPTEAERKILANFAEQGGLVMIGPAWGNAPKEDVYAEVPTGKGRVFVYKEDPPDPEGIARDMLELLPPELMGLSVFNVPSSIAYAGTSGKRVLIQLLNYAGTPSIRVTVRFNGIFHSARLWTPENAPAQLTVRPTPNGRTEVSIPKLDAWAGLILE